MNTLLRTPTFAQSVRGFAVLAEKTAATKLTYRFATFLTLLASALGYSVVLLVWLEVYRENPAPGPIGRDAMLAYLVTAFLVNCVLTLSLEFRFMQRVRMGLIAVDLLRPLGFLAFQLAQGVGDALINLLFALPIALVGFWFVGGALLPPTPGAALLGLLSGGFAFLASFGVTYLIVQATFVLQSGYGILFARAALHNVFSGLAAPLVLFPPALGGVAAWLPFRHIVETPVLLWLGQVPDAAVPRLLFEQLAWGVGLCALGHVVFGAVMRRHQIQGG
jgi:ABC-2 type transport system permease protein